MTVHEREEFWKRIYPLVERFAEEASGCDAMVNRFERRRWDLKFTRRRAGDSPASIALLVAEHAPSKDVMLLVVTATLISGESEAQGVPAFIPVVFNSARDRFSLHADHGPVDESQIPRYFCGPCGGPAEQGLAASASRAAHL